MDNRQHWQDLAEKVEMGLTWIDHDIIEKPVEDFAASTEEIEFTVTTLNCQHNEEPHEKKRVGVFTRGLRSCMSLYTSHKMSPVKGAASTITPVRNSSASKASSEGKAQQQQQHQRQGTTKPTPTTYQSESSGSNSNANGSGVEKATATATTRKKKSKMCLLL